MTALETAWQQSTEQEKEKFVQKICRHYFTLLREKLRREANRRCGSADQREEINEEVA
jgi:hypothetical protein